MTLADRWPLHPGRDVRDALLAAYSHPSRSYHDVRHLTEVLDRLDELSAAGEPFALLPVALAAWFHDGVYDGAPAAEDRSAAWAERTLPAVGVDASTVAEVARLVRLTEHHRPTVDDRNGQALSDADLAILASPSPRYDEYAASVRAEYSQVPDEAFQAGRADILRELLARPRLFHTGHGRACWESAARANIAREIG